MFNQVCGTEGTAKSGSNTTTATQRFENREFPFYEPVIFEPPYSNVVPSTDLGFIPMAQITQHTPILYFVHALYEELMYIGKYAGKEKGEFAVMMLYHQLLTERPAWECFGYFMMPQESSSASVDLSLLPKHFDKQIGYINANYPNVSTEALNIGQFHFHPGMGTSHSGTDYKQQTEMDQLALNEGCRWFVVANEKKETTARVIQYGPLKATKEGKPFIWDNAAIGISCGVPEYNRSLTKARKSELGQMVEDLVIPKRNTYYTGARYGTNYTKQPRQGFSNNQQTTEDKVEQFFNFPREEEEEGIDNAAVAYGYSQQVEDDSPWAMPGMIGYVAYTSVEDYNKHLCRILNECIDALKQIEVTPVSEKDPDVNVLVEYFSDGDKETEKVIWEFARYVVGLATGFEGSYGEPYSLEEFPIYFADLAGLMILVHTNSLSGPVDDYSINELTGGDLSKDELDELIGITFNNKEDSTGIWEGQLVGLLAAY